MAQMNTHRARLLTFVFLAALFFGTLMPGRWKDAALVPLHSPIDLAAAAHVTLFACLAFLLPFARWWEVRALHVFLAGLALALTTEGLQFFAIERHPNLAGVAQDLTGCLLGWLAVQGWRRRRVTLAARR